MRLIAAALLLGLAACGTTEANLVYTPATAMTSPAQARPVVAVGTVVDRREDGREDPRWIGTIRGGYGNAMKRLDAPVPVTEVVRQAFTDALRARGLLATGAPRYTIGVEILQLNANQYVRREGNAEFRISLIPAAGGPPVLVDQGSASRVSGSMLSLAAGAFGSVEELRLVAQQAMSEAIDKLLDKPGFAAALR
ncbi:YajG family lipoprotein [Teichococcus vastitatis]|uniref:YajG family lipoprotein n=1 Tax=Teichococcus vastitatis TaxID=2307076 RepID=A0ABS9W3Y9_9PROT|nr:hypothetical protein [Pseudoroseomonas vastitatis]MCI0753997.1 YajG family lipoprotein [Pseudoroseomonas vastitatis]